MSVVAFDQPARVLRVVLLALAVLSLAGCGGQPRTPEDVARIAETNDPNERMNRAVFAFNEGLDRVVLRPMAMWYRFLVPIPEARDTIRRVVDNAALPWTAVNEVIQGEYAGARISSTRFLINTTLGLGGMIDWATRWGFPHHTEDFGLTLARRFGVRDGPYFVMVGFGPAVTRDAWAMWVDVVGNPVGWLLPFDGVDRRSRHIDDVDEMRNNSLDFYAAVRSMVQQRRRALVNRDDPPTDDIPRVAPEQSVAPAAVAAAPVVRPRRPPVRVQAGARPPVAPWVTP